MSLDLRGAFFLQRVRTMKAATWTQMSQVLVTLVPEMSKFRLVLRTRRSQRLERVLLSDGRRGIWGQGDK